MSICSEDLNKRNGIRLKLAPFSLRHSNKLNSNTPDPANIKLLLLQKISLNNHLQFTPKNGSVKKRFRPSSRDNICRIKELLKRSNGERVLRLKRPSLFAEMIFFPFESVIFPSFRAVYKKKPITPAFSVRPNLISQSRNDIQINRERPHMGLLCASRRRCNVCRQTDKTRKNKKKIQQPIRRRYKHTATAPHAK